MKPTEEEIENTPLNEKIDFLKDCGLPVDDMKISSIHHVFHYYKGTGTTPEDCEKTRQWNSERFKKHGLPMPDDTEELLCY